MSRSLLLTANVTLHSFSSSLLCFFLVHSIFFRVEGLSRATRLRLPASSTEIEAKSATSTKEKTKKRLFFLVRRSPSISSERREKSEIHFVSLSALAHVFGPASA